MQASPGRGGRSVIACGTVDFYYKDEKVRRLCRATGKRRKLNGEVKHHVSGETALVTIELPRSGYLSFDDIKAVVEAKAPKAGSQPRAKPKGGLDGDILDSSRHLLVPCRAGPYETV